MKTRIIYTKLWKDEFFSELSPIEKLLFVYFLTNEKVNIIHCYEISNREIVFDTGVNDKLIDSFKEKMFKFNKIFFNKNWVYLKNSNKYENYSGDKNVSAKQKIIKEMSPEIKDWYNNLLNSPINTPSIGVINYKLETINKKEEIKDNIKSSKKGLFPCTDEEIMFIAKGKEVSFQDVKSIHDEIMLKIEDGIFQEKKYGKTVYYTLNNWVTRSIKSGKLSKKERVKILTE